MIRVLIADDQPLSRVGFRMLLGKIKGVELVGEATDGGEAVDLTRDLQPDIVLMDLDMPSLGGLEAIQQIRALHLPVRIIILSMYVNEKFVQQALRYGVHGYLLKDCGRVELEAAIQAVHQSRAYFAAAALAYFTSHPQDRALSDGGEENGWR